MQNFDGMTVIRSNKWSHLLAAVMLFAVATFFVLILLFANPPLIINLMCYFIIIITIPCGIIHFNFVLKNKVIFAFNDDRFFIKNIDRFVCWKDIKYYYFLTIKSNTSVLLILHNEDYFVNELSEKQNKFYNFNKKHFGYGFSIDFNSMDIKPKDMLEIFQSRCTNLVKEELDEDDDV